MNHVTDSVGKDILNHDSQIGPMAKLQSAKFARPLTIMTALYRVQSTCWTSIKWVFSQTLENWK